MKKEKLNKQPKAEKQKKNFKELQDPNAKTWFKLDNAAHLYPSNQSSTFSFMFRVGAVLKEQVDKDILQKAVDLTLPRFASFKTVLKKGFFWHYLASTNKQLIIEEETKYPCLHLNKQNGFLLRVTYSHHRINIEMCHVLSDGAGAVAMLNSLLATYLELKNNKPIQKHSSIFYYKDAVNEEEVEDSFRRFFQPNGEKGSRKESNVYQLVGTREPANILNVINGEVPADKLKELAKANGCSIHSFINALLCYSIYEYALFNGKHPELLGIENTVNLRNYFKSQSLRNFSYAKNLHFRGDKQYNLEDFYIISNNFMPHLKDVKAMQGFINANVNSQTRKIVKYLPLFIKNLALKIAYKTWGSKRFSLEFSNIGNMSAPEEFKQYIERYECMLGRQKKTPVCAAVITYNNKSVITFSSSISETYLQRTFFKTLARLGLAAKIDSNIEFKNEEFEEDAK